jgi:hypothetical protein
MRILLKTTAISWPIWPITWGSIPWIAQDGLSGLHLAATEHYD